MAVQYREGGATVRAGGNSYELASKASHLGKRGAGRRQLSDNFMVAPVVTQNWESDEADAAEAAQGATAVQRSFAKKRIVGSVGEDNEPATAR